MNLTLKGVARVFVECLVTGAGILRGRMTFSVLSTRRATPVCGLFICSYLSKYVTQRGHTLRPKEKRDSISWLMQAQPGLDAFLASWCASFWLGVATGQLGAAMSSMPEPLAVQAPDNTVSLV